MSTHILGTMLAGGPPSLCQAAAYAVALAAGASLFGVHWPFKAWNWKPTWLKRRENNDHANGAADVNARHQEYCDDPDRPAFDGPVDSFRLVEEMLAQSRYALLLRAQLIANLSPEQLRRTRDALADEMSLVPEGEVDVLLPGDEESLDGQHDPDNLVVVRVGALYMDRFAVTNRQFREFVIAGGYEQMSIWDPHIWPAVLDFVDSSGHLGPRFWKHGRYPKGEEDHPVTGVSWYEASAYARWVGKRLPTDAEWVKSGAWPIPVTAVSRCQRKYPWGDRADAGRANLWSSGIGKTVPVSQFAEGASVGGVHQLTGNVWEWTTGDFGACSGKSSGLILPTPMKSIRGGAFDTYLESQGSCQFQSGESPLSRRHNIGFRCAVGLGDLAAEGFADASEHSETVTASHD